MPQSSTAQNIDPIENQEKNTTPQLEVIEGGQEKMSEEQPKLSIFEKLVQPFGGDKYWEKIANKFEPKELKGPEAKPFKMSKIEKMMGSFGGSSYWEKMAKRLENEEEAEKAIAEFKKQSVEQAKNDLKNVTTEINRTASRLETAAGRIEAPIPDITSEVAELNSEAEEIYEELWSDDSATESVLSSDKESTEISNKMKEKSKLYIDKLNEFFNKINNDLLIEDLTEEKFKKLEGSYRGKNNLLGKISTAIKKGEIKMTSELNEAMETIEKTFDRLGDTLTKRKKSNENKVKPPTETIEIKAATSDETSTESGEQEINDSEVEASESTDTIEEEDSQMEMMRKIQEHVKKSEAETKMDQKTKFYLDKLNEFIDKITYELIMSDLTEEKFKKLESSYRGKNNLLGKISASIKKGEIKMTDKLNEAMKTIEKTFDRIGNTLTNKKKTSVEASDKLNKTTEVTPETQQIEDTNISEITDDIKDESTDTIDTTETKTVTSAEASAEAEEQEVDTSGVENTDITKIRNKEVNVGVDKKRGKIKVTELEQDQIDDFRTNLTRTPNLKQEINSLLEIGDEPNAKDHTAKQKLLLEAQAIYDNIDYVSDIKKLPKIGKKLATEKSNLKKLIKRLEDDIAKDVRINPDLKGFSI